MKYKKKRNIIIGAIIILLSFLAGSLSKQGKEVVKYFSKDAPLYFVERVVDGDTFIVKKLKVESEKLEEGNDRISHSVRDDNSQLKVRFINIDAPEKDECYFNTSKKALEDLIEGKYVKLLKDVSDQDDYGRLLRYVILPSDQIDWSKQKTPGMNLESTSTQGDDLLVDRYLAKNGFVKYMAAPPNNQYRDLISSAMWYAYDNKIGMWKACDYKPDNIQKRQQDEGPENSECIIKGNISEKSFGKTYLVPGCDNYNRVKIDTRKGEAYFCTEEEAIEAGFRKATNCP